MVGGAIEIRNPPPDFDCALERYHDAAAALLNGESRAYKRMFSRREDVSIANPFAPFGPLCRGPAQVAARLERATCQFGDGVIRSGTHVLQPDYAVTPALVNGAAGVVVTVAGRPFAVMGFTVAEGKIVEIDEVLTDD